MFGAYSIVFTSDSLCTTTSAGIEKLDKIIQGSYVGMHQPMRMHPQQQYNPAMMRSVDNSTTITIAVDKITIKHGSGQPAEYYIKDVDGDWTFTIDRSHYTEEVKPYVTALCNEVIADCK